MAFQEADPGGPTQQAIAFQRICREIREQSWIWKPDDSYHTKHCICIRPVRNNTVSLDRVREVWHYSARNDSKSDSYFMAFVEFPSANVSELYSFAATKRLQYMRERCFQFFACTESHSTCFLNLDLMYTQHLKGNIREHIPARATTEATINEAFDLLQRMPKSSTVLPDFDEVRQQQTAKDQISAEVGLLAWDELEVASAVSRNVIMIAFLSAARWIRPEHGGVKEYVLNIINTTSELFEVASMISAEPEQIQYRARWLLLRAFLWTSWQRMVLLHLHQMQALHLRRGFYDYREEKDYVLRRALPATRPATRQSPNKSDYMCNWALELVREQDICIAGELRTLYKRFDECFGDRASRCNASQDAVICCDGIRPDRCQHFINMTGVEEQSAHDVSCDGACKRVVWDEPSYLQVGIMQAVRLEECGDVPNVMTYCSVSSKTLAISHVWIAGTGGRPEEGVNVCLYERFARLARQMGFDSFWWDTACIPSDKTLKKAAIKSINRVFGLCGATLVCDQDLQSIDARETAFTMQSDNVDSSTITCCEQILVTLLVCDWNVRAWTYLESIKGRRNLQILCKDSQNIPFLDVARIVHKFGHIDLSVLGMSMSHLLPSRTMGLTYETENGGVHKTGDTLISLSQAGALLNYRPAREQTDEMLIWSLLVHDDNPFRDPAQFWRSRQNKKLETGFLMSSTPRLEEPGLSWAPKTPNPGRGDSSLYRAYSSQKTGRATITEGGLRGEWSCFEFPTHSKGSMYRALGRLKVGAPTQRERFEDNNLMSADFLAQLDKIEEAMLGGFKHGLLIQPAHGPTEFLSSNDISWALRPTLKMLDQSAAQYRELIRWTLFAVCGANGDFTAPKTPTQENDGLYARSVTWPVWTWRGVFEWPKDVELPDLRRREILIA